MQRIIGFDPSMSNWGIAVGLYDETTGSVQVTDLDVIKPDVPNTGRKSHQDLQRAQQLAEGVLKVVQWYQPAKIYVEVPHGSQSARAMASYAMCIGILGTMRTLDWDFIELTEAQVKMSAVANKTATKEDMIQWAINRHAQAPWPRRTVKGEETIIKGTAEHMADAVGAIHAGLELEKTT